MRTRLAFLLALTAVGLARLAAAGFCGCEKEPPELAALRPPFAWPAGYWRNLSPNGTVEYRPGGEIIFFADDTHPIDGTKKYFVRFLRIPERDVLRPVRNAIFEGYGLPLGANALAARRTYHVGGPSVCTPRPKWTPDPNVPVVTPVYERDQADSQFKWQLRVQVPMLNLGPKRIIVEEADTCTVWRTIDENQFTVISGEIKLVPTVAATDPVTKAPLVDPDGRPLMKAVFEGPYPTGIRGAGDSPNLERWAYLALDVSAIRGLTEAPNTTTPGWSKEWGYDLEGYAVGSPGILDMLALTGWNAQGWTFSTLDQVIQMSQTDQTTFFARTQAVQVCTLNPLLSCTTDADCPEGTGHCRLRDTRITDGVVYWKHEFNTWAADHQPGGQFEPDARDPKYWHLHPHPSTIHPRYSEQHADFDHLIIALKIATASSHRLNKTSLRPFSVHIEATPHIRHDLVTVDPGAGTQTRRAR
jgi:hypothetical protein